MADLNINNGHLKLKFLVSSPSSFAYLFVDDRSLLILPVQAELELHDHPRADPIRVNICRESKTFIGFIIGNNDDDDGHKLIPLFFLLKKSSSTSFSPRGGCKRQQSLHFFSLAVGCCTTL